MILKKKSDKNMIAGKQPKLPKIEVKKNEKTGKYDVLIDGRRLTSTDSEFAAKQHKNFFYWYCLMSDDQRETIETIRTKFFLSIANKNKSKKGIKI
jgi:hypothetical protein